MAERLFPPFSRIILRDTVTIAGVQSAGEESFELRQHVRENQRQLNQRSATWRLLVVHLVAVVFEQLNLNTIKHNALFRNDRSLNGAENW